MKKLLKSLFVLSLLATLVACAPAETKVTGKINVYSRDITSGTREAFEGFIGYKDQMTANAIEASGNGDLAAKVGADTNGIGYVSLTTDFVANNVYPLDYKGIEATEANALNGTYELQRPFNLVTRAAGTFDSADKEQLVAAFADFIMNSVEGREVVRAAGGVVIVDEGTPWATLSAKYPVLLKDNSAITLLTGGSNSAEKTVKVALEAFVPLAGNVKFQMNQTGSGDGYKRVLGSEKDGANKADIGFASRAFKDEEVVSAGMVTGTYCIDAIVAIVNKDNKTITDIDTTALFNIYTGVTKNWEELAK